MAATIGSLKNTIAGILGTTTSVFIVNGVDLLLLALNNARRTAELAHDFYYSQTNVFLTITSTGGNINSATNTQSFSPITVTGTLSPNATGTYLFAGYYEDNPFYLQSAAGAYILFFDALKGWVLSPSGFSPTNYWSFSALPNNPNGTYAANGSVTGAPVVAGASSSIGIKRIQNVLLPLNSGDLIPIEFLTNDDWNSRLIRLYGRQPWNPGLTSYQLGISANNPSCYQQGQTLMLVPPSQFSFPVTASLSVVQWLPDYVNDASTDFFTQFGPEYLQWQGIIEGNKLLETFVQRREGNLDETNLQAEAQAALQALMAWDMTISNGTSTPYAPPAPQPQPAAA